MDVLCISRTCSKCGKQIYNASESGMCNVCLKAFKDAEKIKLWKETGETGCGVATTLRNCIRTYIQHNQNDKCAICGHENIWEGKELKFILDHIDGNAANNYEWNLRLICPNCDSQLDTYKSKNKKSARKFRQQYGE